MQIVRMSSKSQPYLKDLLRDDENKRVDRQRMRYIEFDH